VFIGATIAVAATASLLKTRRDRVEASGADTTEVTTGAERGR
jgi:hypothetical protein